MTTISRENVEIRDTETAIIKPQETDKEVNRTFTVENGDNEIEVKAWGSNDSETWEERDLTTIAANSKGTLICGPHVFIVKLIGKTTTAGTTSIVNATLEY